MGSGNQLDTARIVTGLELRISKTLASMLTRDPISLLCQWDFIHQGQEFYIQW